LQQPRTDQEQNIKMNKLIACALLVLATASSGYSYDYYGYGGYGGYDGYGGYGGYDGYGGYEYYDYYEEQAKAICESVEASVGSDFFNYMGGDHTDQYDCEMIEYEYDYYIGNRDYCESVRNKVGDKFFNSFGIVIDFNIDMYECDMVEMEWEMCEDVKSRVNQKYWDYHYKGEADSCWDMEFEYYSCDMAESLMDKDVFEYFLEQQEYDCIGVDMLMMGNFEMDGECARDAMEDAQNNGNNYYDFECYGGYDDYSPYNPYDPYTGYDPYNYYDYYGYGGYGYGGYYDDYYNYYY